MKVAIVYASTTGNTEALANAAAEAAKNAGRDVTVKTADQAVIGETLSADLILLGSPAMGDEVLEDSMEEFYANLKSSLSGKKVGLFGSYDWGDGQWMRDWEENAKSSGAIVIGTVIANLAPDEAALDSVRKLASA